MTMNSLQVQPGTAWKPSYHPLELLSLLSVSICKFCSCTCEDFRNLSQAGGHSVTTQQLKYSHPEADGIKQILFCLCSSRQSACLRSVESSLPTIHTHISVWKMRQKHRNPTLNNKKLYKCLQLKLQSLVGIFLFPPFPQA